MARIKQAGICFAMGLPVTLVALLNLAQECNTFSWLPLKKLNFLATIKNSVLGNCLRVYLACFSGVVFHCNSSGAVRRAFVFLVSV